MARLSPFAKDREVFLRLAAEHRAKAEGGDVTRTGSASSVVAPEDRSYCPAPRRTFSGFLGRHRRR